MKRKLFLLIPVFAFWLLAVSGILRGGEGRWHDDCSHLWKEGRWHELQALAENLSSIGVRDSESAFYAVQACSPLQEKDRVQILAARYLSTGALNWIRETRLSTLFQPSGLRQRIRLYRTRLAYSILAMIALLNFGAFLRRADLLSWTSFLSAVGCVILLL